MTAKSMPSYGLRRWVLPPLWEKDETCEKRLLDSTGLDLEADGDRWLVSDVRLNSHAQTAGVDLDWEIVWAKLQADRFAK